MLPNRYHMVRLLQVPRMLPSVAREEVVSLGRALERLERPKADERQREGRRLGGKLRQGTTSDDPAALRSAERKAKRARTTDHIVGDAIGLPGTSCYRAKKVVDTAHDESAPPELREAAIGALAEMNATGQINGGFEEVVKARSQRSKRRSPSLCALALRPLSML